MRAYWWCLLNEKNWYKSGFVDFQTIIILFPFSDMGSCTPALCPRVHWTSVHWNASFCTQQLQELEALDTICTDFIIIEFLIRFIVALNRSNFVKFPINIIDILCVLPMWIRNLIHLIQFTQANLHYRFLSSSSSYGTPNLQSSAKGSLLHWRKNLSLSFESQS